MKLLLVLVLWVFQGCPKADSQEKPKPVQARCYSYNAQYTVEGDSYAYTGDSIVIVNGDRKTILLGGPCKVEVRGAP